MDSLNGYTNQENLFLFFFFLFVFGYGRIFKRMALTQSQVSQPPDSILIKHTCILRSERIIVLRIFINKQNKERITILRQLETFELYLQGKSIDHTTD